MTYIAIVAWIIVILEILAVLLLLLALVILCPMTAIALMIMDGMSFWEALSLVSEPALKTLMDTLNYVRKTADVAFIISLITIVMDLIF